MFLGGPRQKPVLAPGIGDLVWRGKLVRREGGGLAVEMSLGRWSVSSGAVEGWALNWGAKERGC